MLDAFTAILRTFPDSHSEIEHTLEDGEWVIIQWSFGGTIARRVCRACPEALAELTRRYFVGHGPATLQDFVWLDKPESLRYEGRSR